MWFLGSTEVTGASFGWKLLAVAMITKDFHTYTRNILRHKKSFRDHGDALA
jgi:hypothetical protein